MEEIDKIILHTLRQIGCDIEDEVQSLGQFSTELVVQATARCLRLVNPEVEVPMSLPPSMSARFRVCGLLAQACSDLGYKGDVGYQTFLYSTETDIRRVFMFLIEKLPKETEKLSDEPLGTARRTRLQVCERLRRQLSVPWLPLPCRIRGLQVLDDGSWVREGYSGTQHFDSVPFTLHQAGSSYRPPPVLEQITNRLQLLPSLIAFNSERLAKADCLEIYQFSGKSRGQQGQVVMHDWSPETDELPLLQQQVQLDEQTSSIPTELISELQESEKLTLEEAAPTGPSPAEQNENTLQTLQQEVEELSSRLEELQLSTRALSAKTAQASVEAESAATELRSQEEKFSVQKRACELLPEAEANVLKLQELVESSTQRLASLAAQWEKHRAPLITAYRELREKNSQKLSESQRQVETLRSLRERIREVSEDSKTKEQLHRQLATDCEKLTKDVSRSSYTRRILEIIGNIRKQKEEIERVLADTRQVQKEINQLTGRLDRSFAVADELIFKDAKRDEAARRAYKLLATLHADCAELVGLVQETGASMREIRDLEDQIEAESSKNVAANLERITADLKQMKQESASLMAQIKSCKS